MKRPMIEFVDYSLPENDDRLTSVIAAYEDATQRRGIAPGQYNPSGGGAFETIPDKTAFRAALVAAGKQLATLKRGEVTRATIAAGTWAYKRSEWPMHAARTFGTHPNLHPESFADALLFAFPGCVPHQVTP